MRASPRFKALGVEVGVGVVVKEGTVARRRKGGSEVKRGKDQEERSLTT